MTAVKSMNPHLPLILILGGKERGIGDEIFPYLDFFNSITFLKEIHLVGEMGKNKPYILTAYADPANGPGWSNTPVWIVVQDDSGIIRMECLQPEEQTPAMQTLYCVSAAVNIEMVREADKALDRLEKRGSK